jgi:hypothetical protein
MSEQALSACEFLIAFLAPETIHRFVEVFQPLMSLKTHFVFESSRTEGAFEWPDGVFVVLMFSHVEKPLVEGGKGLSTDYTLVWLVFRMIGAIMEFQGSDIRVLLPTQLTAVESATFMNGLVFPIHFMAAEGSATGLTGLLLLLSRSW